MAITSENNRALNQDEHNEDAHAKRIIIRGQNPSDGEFYNIAAVDNGDGTFGLSTNASTGSASYENRNDTTTDTNLVYLGKALPGSDVTDAAWQIKRYNKSTGHMSFADDVTTFTKQWSGRTTYGY